MLKIMTALVLAVSFVAYSFSAPVVVAEDGKDDKAECKRYALTFEGVTKENSDKVKKVVEAVEGVERLELIVKDNIGVVVTKPGCSCSEEAVKKALKEIEGVTLKSFIEKTGPNAAPVGEGKKE